MEKRKQLPNTLAKNLRELRQKAGLTQKQMTTELANLGTEITQQSYARYENNNASPDYDTLIKLAVILKTDVNSLVGFGISEEEYFNQTMMGDTHAVKEGDQVIIAISTQSFSMPSQIFAEYVKNAKDFATHMVKLDFDKFFFDSIVFDFYRYLAETNYQTTITDLDQGNLLLRQFMHFVYNNALDDLQKMSDNWEREISNNEKRLSELKEDIQREEGENS